MAKQKQNTYAISRRRQILLSIYVLIMLISIPFGYVMFLIPLLFVPIIIAAICVLTGVIKNKTAVVTVEVFSIMGAVSGLWIMGALLNYYSASL